MKELRPVPASDLKDWWHLVRPSVEKVKQHDIEKWLPEDAYMYLHMGSAFLHVFINDGAYRGCMITRIFNDMNGVCMHIWLSEGNDNIIKDYWPMIKEEAKGIGATYITFVSARKGWGRVYESMGMTKQSLYMCEV